MSVGVRARPTGVTHTDSYDTKSSGFGAHVRYAGHLLVVALLVLIARGVSVHWPQPLRLNLSFPLAQTEPVTVDGVPVTGPEPDAHYLTQGAVPLTVRLSVEETQPILEPHRQVRNSVITYAVQPGDSVLGIAARFGLEGSSLLWANRDLEDNPDWLQIGQELNILPIDGALHTIASGDTLESIAKYYKVEVTDITGYAGNAISSNAELVAGEDLIIPGGTKPYVARSVVAYSGEIPADAKKGTGSFAWPMSGYISQQYWAGHQAIDIAAAKGTTIVAADSGFVVSAQWSDVGYGRMVILDHGNGYQTLYAHMNTFYVEVGQSVAKGQAIGECGNTGYVIAGPGGDGSHLHFEIMQGSARRNPSLFLP